MRKGGYINVYTFMYGCTPTVTQRYTMFCLSTLAVGMSLLSLHHFKTVAFECYVFTNRLLLRTSHLSRQPSSQSVVEFLSVREEWQSTGDEQHSESGDHATPGPFNWGWRSESSISTIQCEQYLLEVCTGVAYSEVPVFAYTFGFMLL